mgnify:CR=1 FL=1
MQTLRQIHSWMFLLMEVRLHQPRIRLCRRLSQGFSDGISDSADGDIEDGDNSQTHVADSASADTDFNSVTDTGTDFSADANAAAQADADSAQNTVSIDNDKITPIINYSQTVKKDANNNEMTRCQWQ